MRPTALEPVWRVAGFALGAATALMGEKAAMACTAAVEEVIDDHYGRQLERLDDDDPTEGTPSPNSAPTKPNTATKRWRAAPKRRPATRF